MKLTLLLLILIGVLGVFSATAQTKENAATKNKTPVLVELFTSEGCSSCPPADKNLTRLEKEQPNTDAEIITLEMHVDYWNYLGWKDEFSLAHFGERQGGYASFFGLDSNYTPQMVVDGQKEFVGSNYKNATNAIAEAVKNPKAAVEISPEILAKKINFKIKSADISKHDESYIWLAVTEDNLTNNVSRGENSGRTLSHTSVVREMKLIGNLMPADKNFNIETAVNLQSNWNKKNLKFVVFVQGKQSKKVFALDRTKLI
ncbi:MAG: DUF1223 domain-containing protein [Acidobacteriota bacterium]